MSGPGSMPWAQLSRAHNNNEGVNFTGVANFWLGPNGVKKRVQKWAGESRRVPKKPFPFLAASWPTISSLSMCIVGSADLQTQEIISRDDLLTWNPESGSCRLRAT